MSLVVNQSEAINAGICRYRLQKVAESSEGQKSFTELLNELKECQWYWGGISPQSATRLLRQHTPGTFLVRDSRSEKSIFSFSYSTPAGVYHSRIYRFNGRFCLGGPNALIRSASLREFVEQTIVGSSETVAKETTTDEQDQPSTSASINTSESAPPSNPPLQILMHPSSMEPVAQPVDIRYPLCRNRFVPSLQGACRLAIRRQIADQTPSIHTLPLPKKLRKYIAAPDYLLSFAV